MTRKYCKGTPINKMGFSQIASCKALGFIARTSKSLKRKFIKSPKYRKRHIDEDLFSNSRKKSKIKIGYGTEETALKTLKNIKKFAIGKQIQIVNTMYNRAKFHANKTVDMRKAMKVYRKWLKNNT